MYANPTVIGRAKIKSCRLTPGYSSPPLSRSSIFLSVCAFFLDLYVTMPFQCTGFPARPMISIVKTLVFEAFGTYVRYEGFLYLLTFFVFLRYRNVRVTKDHRKKFRSRLVTSFRRMVNGRFFIMGDGGI